MVNEHALKNSFRAIRADMLKLEGDIMSIKEQQAGILVELEMLNSALSKSAKKTSSKKK